MSEVTLNETVAAQHSMPHAESRCANWAKRLEATGRHTTRYGLVLVLLWIGAMKFTSYEAEAISSFVSHSPLMSWAYSIFSMEQFSALIGGVELVIAVLIGLGSLSARLSVAGGVLGVGMFFTTLTFLITTPGVWESSLGFPALSVVPGQFLVKDVVLLGATLWCTGEAMRPVGKGV